MSNDNTKDPTYVLPCHGETVSFYLTKRKGTPAYQYYFRMTDPNTGKRKTYRGTTKEKSKKDAEVKLFTTIVDIQSGAYFKKLERKKQGFKSDVLTFEEVSSKFLKHKFSTNQKLREKTKTDYKRTVKYLNNYFGKKNIEDTPKSYLYAEYQKARCSSYMGEESTITYMLSGKPVTRSRPKRIEKDDYGKVAVNREMELFFQIIKWASKEYGINSLANPDKFHFNKEKGRKDILNKDEYIKLKNWLLENNPYYLQIIRFIISTGIRPGELFALKWKHIFLDKEYMEVLNRKNTRVNLSKRESAINTAVPIAGKAKEILLQLKSRETIPTGDEDYVFVNDSGRHVKRIEKVLQRGLTECNIEKSISLNVFRHQAATRMTKKYDADYARTVLGHSPKSTMLEEIYLHIGAEDFVKRQREVEKKHIQEVE